jgi:AraC family transcriptional regulator
MPSTGGKEAPMALTAKALWYLESNLTADLTLSGVADQLSVSAFHLARTFATTTGQPLMRYVRRRRLSQAAEALALVLASGQGTVLDVALQAGYQSHEGFSRAFRAEFGVAPSALRQPGAIDHLHLTQALLPRTNMTHIFTKPIVEPMPERIIAGLSHNYDMQTRVEIPALWGRYNDEETRAATPHPDDYYGVCYGFTGTGTFSYLCGQILSARADLPPGFAKVTLPAGPYARFVTKGHISTMSQGWAEVYNDWLTRPEYRPRTGPSVEYYPPEFDGMTGDGGYELWLPVEAV